MRLLRLKRIIFISVHLDDHTIPKVLAAHKWSPTPPPIFQPPLKNPPPHPTSPKSFQDELVPLMAHLHGL